MNEAHVGRRPVPRPGVLDIAAYVPGREGAHGDGPVFKLSSNESPLGPSPDAIAAYSQVAHRLGQYPDGSSNILREAIADRYSLNAANILCGNGSDELLGLLAQTYLSAGDEAIYSAHGFLVYRIQILAAGATPVVAGECDETASVDAMLDAVSPLTKMVFLANPNNPTGTYLPIDEVRRLQAGLPPRVLLVLDAAYAEYVRRNDYEAGLELVSSCSNVVMTRTFSKIFGLAALRIGWIYAPSHVIDAMNRVRGPFNVNAAALAAGAAAMADHDHLELAVNHNERWLTWLRQELSNLGLRVTPSVGNFLLIHFPEDLSHTATQADDYLLAQGFVVRQVAAYGFPNALRMSVGSEDANRGFVAAIARFLEG